LNDGSRRTAGLSPDRIVDAAMELSEGRGLHTWSIRDLAKRLDVVPSVIYHHVGGEDELCRRVVGRVTARMVRPDPALEWQDWFRALLFPARAILRPYPGVAMWLMMHGPTFEHLTPIIDDGIAALKRAGFGERTGLAYAAILNSAMLTVDAADGSRDDGADAQEPARGPAAAGNDDGLRRNESQARREQRAAGGQAGGLGVEVRAVLDQEADEDLDEAERGEHGESCQQERPDPGVERADAQGLLDELVAGFAAQPQGEERQRRSEDDRDGDERDDEAEGRQHTADHGPGDHRDALDGADTGHPLDAGGLVGGDVGDVRLRGRRASGNTAASRVVDRLASYPPGV
jgi:AcrR family transcriptional regulator